MNSNLTEIVCIIDRSGSMAAIQRDAIGGFNSFLAGQKRLDGEASLTLVLFDHEYERVLDGVPLSEVGPLTPFTYVPRGSTALLDAVGRTIDEVGRRLAATAENERPGKILVCILTDGLENASRFYGRRRIQEMIEHQQAKYGWEFQFLAANQDAFAEARRMGIAQRDAAPFVADSEGVKEAFSALALRASTARRQF